MIYKKQLTEYEFKTMFDYYNYIVESIINGQRKQAEDLINQLSKAQKKDAIDYFNMTGESEHIKEAEKLTLELL